MLEIYGLDLAISRRNHTTAVIAQSREDVQKIFRIVKVAFDKLPDNMKPAVKYDNVNELYFHEQNSSIYVASSIRGGTINYLHFSEAAFTKNLADKLMASAESVPKDGQIVLETTANGFGETFHMLYRAAQNGENDYLPHFYGWNEFSENTLDVDAPLELSKKEAEMKEKHGLTDGQIAWRRWKIRNMPTEEKGLLTQEQRFQQEHPLTAHEAFISSGGNVFSVELLNDLLESANKPLSREQIQEHPKFAGTWDYENYLEVWELPKGPEKYVMGTDCAEGSFTGDYSVTSVWNSTTGEQVAELRCRIPIEKFAELSEKLGRIYNNAFWGIEDDHGYGKMVISRVRESYPRLFRREVGDGLSTGTKLAKKYGWSTNAGTKPTMIQDFREAMYNGDIPFKINSTTLLSECSTYLEEDGITNAAVGSHDDTVMAAAIAWQMRKYAGRTNMVVSSRRF